MSLDLLKNLMESKLFRIITLLLGLVLCPFYGIVMIGAIACHPIRILIDYFPDSWLFIAYQLGGVLSGILCFIYVDNPKKNKLFFFIIVPFVIFMIIPFLG
jgi:hypothetical protein